MRLPIHRLLLALAAAIILATPGARADDVKHVHNDNFEITLPAGFADFAEQTQSVPLGDGKIHTTNWISRSPGGEAVVVTVSRMPGPILDPDQMLASTRDSLLKSLGATLEKEEKMEGETAGSVLLFRSNAPAFMRSQLSVEGDRLYNLLYVGRAAEQRDAPVVSELFRSFHIRGAETPGGSAAAASSE